MKVDHLSPSRIGVYLQCPERYWYKYESGKTVSSEYDYAGNSTIGVAVHKVLDEFNKDNKGKFVKDIEPVDIDYRITRFRAIWKDLGAHNPELAPSGEELIKNYFTNYKKYLPSDAQILDSEFMFEFYLENGIPIKGIIDVIYKVGKSLLVIDYKTGRYAPSQEEIADDIQLSLYDLAMKEKYPRAESIDLAIYNLVHGLVKTSRTDSDRVRVLSFLESLYATIESDKTHTAKLNNLCSWCDYKKDCKAYNEILETDSKSLVSMKYISSDPSKLIAYLSDLRVKSKILEEHQEQAQALLLEVFKAGNMDNFEAPSLGRAKVVQNQITNYNVSDIVFFILGRGNPKFKEVLDKLRKNNISVENELDGVLKTKKSEIDKLIEVFPNLGNSVRKITGFGNAYIKISTSKALPPATTKKLGKGKQ